MQKFMYLFMYVHAHVDMGALGREMGEDAKSDTSSICGDWSQWNPVHGSENAVKALNAAQKHLGVCYLAFF